MSSPNRWSIVRDNIVAAIKALPGYTPNIEVVKLGIVSDILRLGPRTAIGVCLASETWIDIEKGLNNYLDKEATMDIPIVLMATSEASPVGALEEGGALEDLSELILGSASLAAPTTGPGLRSANVGINGYSGGVYLRAVETQIVPDSDRAVGSGGTLLKIILMRTTSVPL